MANPEEAINDRGDKLLERLEAIVDRLHSVSAPDPEFMTVNEAARRIGIGIKALHGAVRRGEVSVFRLGTDGRGRPRVRLGEVREWAMATAFDPAADARRAGELAARQIGRGRSGKRIQ